MIKQLICWLKTGHKNRINISLYGYIKFWRFKYDSYPPSRAKPSDYFYLCKDCKWPGATSKKRD